MTNQKKTKIKNLIQLDFPYDAKADKGIRSTDILYFYTNRDNLLIFLASGFILPKNLNKKYYNDFGSSPDNGLILMREKLSIAYLNTFSESESSFPVCLQVSIPTNLTGEVLFIMPDESIVKTGFKLAPENYTGVVIPGILTLRDKFKILFYDDVSLKEFTAREFEDINYEHFEISADPSSFGDQNKLELNKFLKKTDLPQIDLRRFTAMDRLSALLTTMESAIEEKSDIFLLKYLEYCSLYFEKFSTKELKRINDPGIPENPDKTGSEKIDLRLLMIPLAVSYGNANPVTGFNSFVKELKISKSLDAENYFSHYLLYCAVLTISYFDSSHKDYAEYLSYMQKLVDEGIDKFKKKGMPDKESNGKLFVQAAQYLNSEISFNDLKTWPDSYSSLKLFLLFLKRFDYESIREYQTERGDFMLDDHQLLIIQLLASVFSGYMGMPGKMKKHNEVTFGAFDALINYLTDNQYYTYTTTKFAKSKSVEECPEYESILYKIIGIYGYTYSKEKKDYHTSVRSLITENKKPEKISDLIELAKFLKIPRVILYSASISSKDFVDQRTRDDRTIFYAHTPFITKTEFNFERFSAYMKEKIVDNDLNKVPLELKKNIEELYSSKTEPQTIS